MDVCWGGCKRRNNRKISFSFYWLDNLFTMVFKFLTLMCFVFKEGGILFLCLILLDVTRLVAVRLVLISMLSMKQISWTHPFWFCNIKQKSQMAQYLHRETQSTMGTLSSFYVFSIATCTIYVHEKYSLISVQFHNHILYWFIFNKFDSNCSAI